MNRVRFALKPGPPEPLCAASVQFRIAAQKRELEVSPVGAV